AWVECRLHPVKDIYGGPMFFDLDDADTVLRFYREFIADAPEQFGGFPAWPIAPPLPLMPPGGHGQRPAPPGRTAPPPPPPPRSPHGQPPLALVACRAGPMDQGERPLKPLHDVAP